MSNTPTITFSQCNKGKRVLVCDGYVYHLNKLCSKAKYWRCGNRLCAAVIHTDINDEFKVRKGDHSNHLSSPAYIEILSFKSNIKQCVVTEATPIGRIYDEELVKAQLSQTALSVVASTQDAKSSLNRIHRLETPRLPITCRFDIPTLYNLTINVERFLLYDKMRRNKRNLIFATGDQLRVLFKAKQILMDGTFSLYPHFLNNFTRFMQLSFPFAFVLLAGRSGSIYKEMLQQLEEEPDDIYKDDANVRNFCRRLMALPFLPLYEVDFAFEELAEQRPNVLAPLFIYFDNY
ncbi:unnamed protein product [Rotaria magnacalcarata]|uniref:FLYWCH-type domain-containing protein n=1 Tax=Rotaria magnacalcarata TaxID=392030 RepID=A0A820EBY0_9BILA|nr:unnamed protein product [Rotaria magnacalcarata]